MVTEVVSLPPLGAHLPCRAPTQTPQAKEHPFGGLVAAMGDQR